MPIYKVSAPLLNAKNLFALHSVEVEANSPEEAEGKAGEVLNSQLDPNRDGSLVFFFGPHSRWDEVFAKLCNAEFVV